MKGGGVLISLRLVTSELLNVPWTGSGETDIEERRRVETRVE